MRRMISVFLSGVLLVFVLAGCGLKTPVQSTDSQGTGEKGSLAGMKEIEEGIKEQGYSTECEPIDKVWLSGEQYRMVLNDDLNSQIVFYVYETPEDAREETGYIDRTGCLITVTEGGKKGQVIVDWVNIPHFYQYQNLIVQYVGLDETVLTVLEEICGAYFAGGNLS